MREAAWIRPVRTGVVAQLVERLNGIQKVRGSTPLGSTILTIKELMFGWPILTTGSYNTCKVGQEGLRPFKIASSSASPESSPRLRTRFRRDENTR